jgi:hypothetical protein
MNQTPCPWQRCPDKDREHTHAEQLAHSFWERTRRQGVKGYPEGSCIWVDPKPGSPNIPLPT